MQRNEPYFFKKAIIAFSFPRPLQTVFISFKSRPLVSNYIDDKSKKKFHFLLYITCFPFSRKGKRLRLPCVRFHYGLTIKAAKEKAAACHSFLHGLTSYNLHDLLP